MYRLFVAVVPPPAVRDRLLDIMGGVAGARWQRDDQLHMTLRFIGEVDRNTAHDIAAALAALHHPAFDVDIGGFGTFAARGRANALWTGVSPADAVAALHKKVDQALLRAGIPADTRAFHPHITLARLGRSAGPVADFIGTARIGELGFQVADFSLVESVLSADGAAYRIVERYTLTRPRAAAE